VTEEIVPLLKGEAKGLVYPSPPGMENDRLGLFLSGVNCFLQTAI
jgi:hypothetical protein